MISGDIDAYLRLCVPSVDFFDEGVKNHDSIRRSREKLIANWPVYRVRNVRDVNVQDTADPARKSVSFTYEWEVHNPAKQTDKSGTAKDTLDMHKIGGRWLIAKMRQERVAR